MSKKNKLFSFKHPYDTFKSDELFFLAMRENCAFQYKNCPDYKRILDSKNFHPDMIKCYDDIKNIPFITTLYLKRHKMFSMKERKMLITATSSGTSSGVKSVIGFNFLSLWRGLKMVIKLTKYHHLLSLKPCRYVIFGYEYNRKNEMAIAKTAFGFTFFAPAISRDYALRYTKNGYKLDLNNLKKKLIKYAKHKTPVRTIGFPAYTYFLLKQMKDEGLSLKLPKGSKLTLGGGWKQFYAEKIEKKEFYKLVYEVLGIEDKNIVEFFGAVEHPILYTDCSNHHFHIPVYSRVIIRDINTLQPVKYGEIGLINLLTPMVDSVPLLSVMTDDLGILHNEKCECGIESPWLEIIGRVGIKDIITCAAGAEEYLKGEKK